MKELQDHIERWFKERRAKKHIAKALAVREEIAGLTAMIETRQRLMCHNFSDRGKTIKMIGRLAELKVRLAYLDAITRKVEPTV